MAGHSKWSKVKHIKGPLDQKRGQLFPKLAKEIAVPAQMGEGDLVGHARWRTAILAVRAVSVHDPKVTQVRVIEALAESDGGPQGSASFSPTDEALACLAA